MALYVKDPEVDRLAERVSRIGRISKTEAVRRALRHELERMEPTTDRTEQILALTRELKKQAGSNPQPADKAWIDSLYE